VYGLRSTNPQTALWGTLPKACNTQHCACTNPYRYRCHCPGSQFRQEIDQFHCSTVPRVCITVFGDRVIRFRCDSKAHTAVRLVCSAPLRGRSTQLRIGTYCIWHYYSIIDELAQYRNCNRSARPTGQYPKLLASAFASFTPVL
jgi:hypothetical protein